MEKLVKTEIELHEKDQRFIQRLVAAGRFASPSHVVRAALDLVEREDRKAEKWTQPDDARESE